MKEQLVSFETAKLAKEKGFDEVCSYLYENSKEILYRTHKNSGLNKYFDWYSAPTQSLLQKWLREEFNKVVLVDIGDTPYLSFEHNYSNNTFDTYEEALEEGLYETLKLI